MHLIIYIALVLYFILLSDSMAVKLNRMKSELYCMYRLWKNESWERSTPWFAKELFLIVEGKREDIDSRYKWLAARWNALSDNEKSIFIECNRQRF